MLNQFTEEYRNVMLAAENRVKQFGYKEILPEDIVFQIANISSGNIADLFATFGINQTIITDVLSRPPFQSIVWTERAGDYIGISSRLKELIVASMKVASTFQKSQAWIEDFMLAIFRTETENWFYKLLDFIGITPKDFESELVELNTLISGASESATNGGLFGPIEEIMNMIEDTFGNTKKPGIDGMQSTKIRFHRILRKIKRILIRQH